VGHGISGTLGMSVAIAVRPEKIHIAKARPGVNAEPVHRQGARDRLFRQLQHLIVDMANGRSIKITETNTTRRKRRHHLGRCGVLLVGRFGACGADPIRSSDNHLSTAMKIPSWLQLNPGGASSSACPTHGCCCSSCVPFLILCASA
jgi:hypothetical protein